MIKRTGASIVLPNTLLPSKKEVLLLPERSTSFVREMYFFLKRDVLVSLENSYGPNLLHQTPSPR